VKFEKVKKTTKLVGSFSYSDPASGVSVSSSKVTSLTFSGNTAHFTGTAKQGKKSVSFTVDVADNGPGTSDIFTIHLSTGYSASGNLTSGDISVQ
jgi:hypothetical protein